MTTSLAAVSVTVLAGCTGSSAPEPVTTPTTPPASTTAPPTPSQALQQLAKLGATSSYRAFYAARQRRPSSQAKWQVWRTKKSLRVDVVTKRSTATLIQTPRATYSCSRAHGRKTCFRVAKAGQPVPALFRLLAERLFSSALVQFAQHISRYRVTTVDSDAASTTGSCFAVKAPKSKKPAPVETATYCLDDHGVLTAALYPNKNSVRLLKVVRKTPPKHTFVPYSSPTPLPG